MGCIPIFKDSVPWPNGSSWLVLTIHLLTRLLGFPSLHAPPVSTPVPLLRPSSCLEYRPPSRPPRLGSGITLRPAPARLSTSLLHTPHLDLCRHDRSCCVGFNLPFCLRNACTLSPSISVWATPRCPAQCSYSVDAEKILESGFPSKPKERGCWNRSAGACRLPKQPTPVTSDGPCPPLQRPSPSPRPRHFEGRGPWEEEQRAWGCSSDSPQ